MLALLASVALAAPVVEPLLHSGSGFFDAELLPLPSGEVAVVAYPGDAVPSAVVLLPEAGRWRGVASPGGTLVAAEDGLHSLALWAGTPIVGGHWRLDGAGWTTLEPLPPLPRVDGVQAASMRGGGVTAWVSRAGGLVRLTERAAGWAESALPPGRAWDDGGRVYTTAGGRVRRGPLSWQAPGVTGAVFDEGPRGAPLFVAAEDGRLRIWHAGEAHTAALPRTVLPPAQDCLEGGCPARRVDLVLPGPGRLAFRDGRPVVAAVQAVVEGDRTCAPAPEHPCDPPNGPNTCPTGPQYQCAGPKGEPARTVRLWERTAGGWSESTLDLPVSPLRVFDTHVSGAETWLLLEAGSPGGPRSLVRVRLDAETAAWPVAWSAETVSAPFSPHALAARGFVPGQGTSGYAPPAAWQGGALRTGGPAHGAAWVDRLLPAPGPVAVSVEADVAAWHAGCGQPELRVQRGRAAWTLRLAADPLTLVPLDGPAIAIDAPAHGAHTWGLTAAADAVVVTVDGAEVHRQPAAFPEAERGSVSVGQRMSCGVPVGPAATWKRVTVGPPGGP